MQYLNLLQYLYVYIVNKSITSTPLNIDFLVQSDKTV